MLDRRAFIWSAVAAGGLGLFSRPLAASSGDEYLLVKAKRKPPDQWTTYPTRTVHQLRGFVPDSRNTVRNKYGGWPRKRVNATGFFTTRKQGDRWWLLDPEGCAYLGIGVGEVYRGGSRRSQAALKAKFGTVEKWADETASLLTQHGFNSLGGSPPAAELRRSARRLPYTMLWEFNSTFPPARQPPMLVELDTNFCIPVFHPKFEVHCDERAKALTAFKDDPYLIGYYSDNELSAGAELLDMSLTLDPRNPDTAPGYEAARQWFTRRKSAQASFPDITDDDRDAFRGYVFERYFEVTTRAIRKYDPNHLCLGCRLNGMTSPDTRAWGPFRSPKMWEAAGRHLDAISVNIYWQWTPVRDMLAGWYKVSQKPILVSEFYAKGDDMGFGNYGGSGWIVPTQRDRSLFYQNFVLGLLESKTCDGWNWFKYQDDDPEDPKAGIISEVSQKGMVRINYEPYQAVLDGMREINEQVYAIIEYFDKE